MSHLSTSWTEVGQIAALSRCAIDITMPISQQGFSKAHTRQRQQARCMLVNMVQEHRWVHNGATTACQAEQMHEDAASNVAGSL